MFAGNINASGICEYREVSFYRVGAFLKTGLSDACPNLLGIEDLPFLYRSFSKRRIAFWKRHFCILSSSSFVSSC